MNCFKFSKWLNNSIYPIDETLTATTTPSQSRYENDGNKWVLYIPKWFRTGASSFGCLVSNLGYSLGSFTPLQRGSRKNSAKILHSNQKCCDISGHRFTSLRPVSDWPSFSLTPCCLLTHETLLCLRLCPDFSVLFFFNSRLNVLVSTDQHL